MEYITNLERIAHLKTQDRLGKDKQRIVDLEKKLTDLRTAAEKVLHDNIYADHAALEDEIKRSRR